MGLENSNDDVVPEDPAGATAKAVETVGIRKSDALLSFTRLLWNFLGAPDDVRTLQKMVSSSNFRTRSCIDKRD